MLTPEWPIFVAEPENSESLIEWREHQESLTDKLEAIKGSTQLDLLSQLWIKSTWWDRYFLQIKEDFIFQREIIMKHKGLEYWYARSIIPQSCYDAAPQLFKRLEKESIKNLIFNNSEVHRIQMISYPINKQCIEYYWIRQYLNQNDAIIWVRLAEYSLNYTKSFYLAELLLPQLENIS